MKEIEIYINGERTFQVNRNILDKRGYIQITDVDTGVIFYLPEYVIKQFSPGLKVS